MKQPDILGPCRLLADLEPGSLGRRYRSMFDGQKAIVETTSIRGDGELFERSLRRIEVMTMVDHRHLVPILHAGIERDELFIVTPEPDMTADRCAPLGLDAREIIGQVARGLAHLHQNGAIHRDIQRRHIGMYDGVVKLGGFALSDIDGPGSTQGVGPIGGVLTMAPSIVRGEAATTGSDLYSLGATLHLLATGIAVHPERSESLATRVLRLATDEPTIDPLLPKPLDSLVRSMLAADGLDIDHACTGLIAELATTTPSHRPSTTGDTAP